MPPLKIVQIWPDGTTCWGTQTGERFLCSQFICGRGLGLNAKNAIFAPLGDRHPSPNYFSDPKPKFLVLSFRDASNGTTRDPLGPGIRVAKIRGHKHSTMVGEKQFAEFLVANAGAVDMLISGRPAAGRHRRMVQFGVQNIRTNTYQ